VTAVRQPGRWGLPVAIVVLAVVAGCQQPTPGVTLQSGSRVVREAATLYVRDGRQVPGSRAVKVLTVRPGAVVGIDVDRSLADQGWAVHISTRTSNATTLNSPILKSQRHFSFDVGSSATDVVVSEQGAGGAPAGLWAFTLQPTLQ
jgi:hypothetical protein